MLGRTYTAAGQHRHDSHHRGRDRHATHAHCRKTQDLASFGGRGSGRRCVRLGSLWVSTAEGPDLYRINPATDKVVARIDIGMGTCGVPLAALGRIWVGHCGDGSTKNLAVDPGTNKVAGSATGWQMTFGGGHAWIQPGGGPGEELASLDTRTVRVGRARPLMTLGVVYGDGHLWAAMGTADTGQYAGRILELDPTTLRTIRSMRTPQPGTNPTVLFAYGNIWMKGGNDGRLVRISPTTGTSTTFRIPGHYPLSQTFDITVFPGLGSLWFRSANGTVSRVNPSTRGVDATYAADSAGGGGDTVVAFGSLWVENFAANTVWKDTLTPQA